MDGVTLLAVACVLLAVVAAVAVLIFRKRAAKREAILIVGNANAGKTLLHLQVGKGERVCVCV